MSLALYRKYRPQKWSDLTGQNHIKVTLQHEIENNKVSHAYLFTGPRGIGKTTTARLLAKTINCEKRSEGTSEPCNKCNSCVELTDGADLDILEIDAASHTGVDNVRENIIANARFTPAKRKYKVFIIDEVHMLSIAAFNALLKSLEEPPMHAIFILATTEIHKVPATIISRCQRFDFKKVNATDLLNRLTWICQQEGIKVSPKVLNDIASVSEGCLRDAESLLGQILSLGTKEIGESEASLIIPSSNYNLVIELLNGLIYRNSEIAITLINKLVDEGVDLLRFTDDSIEILRKIMLSKISGGLKDFSFDLDTDREKEAIALGGKFELVDLIMLINLFSQKKFEIKTAAISQLPLELAVIEYCQELNNADSAPNPEKGDGDNKPPAGGSLRPESKDGKKNEEIKSGTENTTLKNSNLVKTDRFIEKIDLTLDEIKDKWHNFLVRLQESNASMVFILKVAEPLALTGNILRIGFKYAFHQQRVNQAKVKEAIEKVMAEFFQKDIIIETCSLAKDYDSKFIKEQTKTDEVELVEEVATSLDGQDQQQLIETLVKTFGGKVVE